MLPEMQHTRTWSDIYGSALADFMGRAGGHPWLVAAPPELAASVPAALDALDGKGHMVLVVHDGLTPLLAALREAEPYGVLIVAEQPLASGPAVNLPQRLIEDAGGVEYSEGGDFPAWTGADSLGGAAGECAAASAAASLGFPVVVTAPDSVCAALEAWMDRVPHGR